jgi:hypothetical protein
MTEHMTKYLQPYSDVSTLTYRRRLIPVIEPNRDQTSPCTLDAWYKTGCTPTRLARQLGRLHAHCHAMLQGKPFALLSLKCTRG